jgi:hypothetical protein
MERKQRAATFSGLILVIVAAVLVVVNVLAFGANKRFDMTKNERFTLSKGSGRLVRELSKKRSGFSSSGGHARGRCRWCTPSSSARRRCWFWRSRSGPKTAPDSASYSSVDVRRRRMYSQAASSAASASLRTTTSTMALAAVVAVLRPVLIRALFVAAVMVLILQGVMQPVRLRVSLVVAPRAVGVLR